MPQYKPTGEPTLAVRRSDGTLDVLYVAQAHQIKYHESVIPNLLMTGPRGTGKSICMRMDAHMRAMAVPGFKYLVLRRTMPALKSSHLFFVKDEMERLGGTYNQTDFIARYPNGSAGWYGHCETEADVMRYLSAEYDLIIFDEASTFTQDIFMKIAACVRVPEGSGRIGMIRGGTNPLGVGARFIKTYFITKDVRPEENQDYHPDDYAVIATVLTDNQYVDLDQYRRRLESLPAHVRSAWLEGLWIEEGAYFEDFRAYKDGKQWHVIDDLPTLHGRSLFEYSWLSVYRAIDWGYFPDPAVCLWIAVLPNKRTIVFKEKTWRRTLASDVAAEIKRESDGMHIVETFCDPTMFIKTGVTTYSMGELFEQAGVPLTESVNKRDLAGYAIHDYLNRIFDELPQLQIVEPCGVYGCPELIRTLPMLRMDPNDPKKIGDGDDHWAIALAYFCMAGAPPSRDPTIPVARRWMQPRRSTPAYV